VAPANEQALGVVGTTHVLTDADHRELYDAAESPATPMGRAINVFRPFPTRGIELWGSRTLADDQCLRHLPVRRGLSAIERQAAASLAEVVFEPNSPVLAIRVTQMMATLLLRLFDAGALRGATPEEAFTVRCDDEVNPPEAVAEGQFVCEVSVAIAAPSEFIVFRLAMRDQAIQVVEP
jgi:phage tail sheath protein FI